MKEKLSKVLWGLVFAVVIFSVVFANIQRAAGVLNPMFWGWGIAFVETGSMEPNIPVGSLILLHEQDSYNQGDVVTYNDESNQYTVTHRIIYTNNDIVVTQGDANNVADKPFLQDRIVGKVVFWIPYVGFLFALINKPIVTVLLLVTGLVLLYLGSRQERSENDSFKAVT